MKKIIKYGSNYDSIGVALVIDFNWVMRRFTFITHILFWFIDFRFYLV